MALTGVAVVSYSQPTASWQRQRQILPLSTAASALAAATSRLTAQVLKTRPSREGRRVKPALEVSLQ